MTMARSFALLVPSVLALAAEDGNNVSLSHLLLLPTQVQSASLFVEDELQVGASVTTITADRWQTQGVRSTTEIATMAPGLAPIYYADAPSIGIRGFSNAAPSGTLTRLDGMNLSTYDTGQIIAQEFDRGLLDRVEVVRGPASALYGSPAFLGLISERTRESLGDEAEASIEGTSSSQARGMVFASRSLGRNLRISAGMARSHQGDQAVPYDFTSPDSGQVETSEYAFRKDLTSGLAKLTWTQGPVRIDVGYYGYHEESTHTPGMSRSVFEYPQTQLAANETLIQLLVDPTYRAPLTANFLRDRNWTDTDKGFQALRAGLAIDLPNEMALESTVYQWWEHNQTTLDVSRSRAFEFTPPPSPPPTLSTLGGTRRSRQQSTELHLKQNDNPAHLQWVIGVSVMYQSLDELTSTTTNADGSIYSQSQESFGDTPRTTTAGLGQIRWSALPDRLHLLAGARVDHLSDLDRTETSSRAGVILQPQRDQALKLLWGRSFRAPTASELRAQAPPGTFNGRDDLASDVLNAYELIWMQDLAPFRYDAQVSYNRWTNAPITSPNQGLYLQYDSDPRIDSWAGEWEGHYDDGAWLADLGGAATRARNRTSGRFYGSFPTLTVQAGIGHRFRNHSQVYLTNVLRGRTDDSPASQTSPDTAEMLPTYWRTDLTIAHPLTSWLTIRAEGRNLLARHNAIPSYFGAENGIPESPRPSALLGADAQW